MRRTIYTLVALPLLLAGALQSVSRYARREPSLVDSTIVGMVWDVMLCSIILLVLGGWQSWSLGERLYAWSHTTKCP